MKKLLLFGSILFAGALCAQKTKTNTAKIDFIQYPTVPVDGMTTLGVQVYTADLPFNKDTLRLYLGNMDAMKSDVERMSKIDFQSLNEVTLVGGEGDLSVDMAFGTPVIGNKEVKTGSCMIAKDGCVQYFYKVNYSLPTILQVRNKSGVLEVWELDSEMVLQFGNEQVEKQQNTDKGSTTSVQVVSYSSEADLAMAFKQSGAASLARKAIVRQIGKMAESIYDRAFFEQYNLKLDIAYGSGSATDYTETEGAAEAAVTAIESKDHSALAGPIAIWEAWLERYTPGDKKAAVNDKVAQGLHENLSIGYTFTGEFDKARTHLDKALEFSQQGFVNTNEVARLKAFHTFINKQEKVKQYNSALKPIGLVAAPDIKKLLGRRKFNENIDFLIAEDKYAEIAKNYKGIPAKKDASNMTLDELLNQSNLGSASGSGASGEISLDGRVENNMLVLSSLIDGNMRGQALPNSICDYPDIEVIRARNIGLTSLPDCMADLVNLEKLYINSNSFESLPDMFANMKNLEVLDISNNQLSSLPESIFTLTHLKKMMIEGNQLSEADLKRLMEALPNTSFK